MAWIMQDTWGFFHACSVLIFNLSMTSWPLTFFSLEARTHLMGHLWLSTWKEDVVPAEIERGKVTLTENKLCKFAGFGELLCVFCYMEEPVFPECAFLPLSGTPFHLINVERVTSRRCCFELRMPYLNICQHKCMNSPTRLMDLAFPFIWASKLKNCIKQPS